MKKISLIALIVVLASGFVASDGAQLAMAKGKYGGIFKWNWRSPPAVGFGVPLEARGPVGLFGLHSLQPLVRIGEKPGTWEPCLAVSWELAPDKSSYIFQLRKGVKFHDGTDFNAQAVKWNLDRVRASKRPLLKEVKSFDIIDSYSIRANLSAWNAHILYDFADQVCMIISPTAYEKHGAKGLSQNPVGTGPFKVKEVRARQWVKYEKNPDYWDKGLPYLDGIEIHLIPDPMTAKAALLKGELHGLQEAEMIDVKELEATGKYKSGLICNGNMHLWFDTTSPDCVWTDKRMREALEYAVDREKIAKSLGYGYVKPVYEIIMGITEVGSPGTTPRKYDPKKAKQLMAEAGHPGGAKVVLKTEAKFNTDFVVALQEDLAQVGIDMKIEPLAFPAWMELRFLTAKGNEFRFDRQRGSIGDLLHQVVAGDLTIDSLYYAGVKRPARWKDLIDQLKIMEDFDKQLPLMEEMERLAYADAMFCPLWDAPDFMIYEKAFKWDKNVRGTVWNTAGLPMMRLEYLWLEK